MLAESIKNRSVHGQRKIDSIVNLTAGNWVSLADLSRVIGQNNTKPNLATIQVPSDHKKELATSRSHVKRLFGFPQHLTPCHVSASQEKKGKLVSYLGGRLGFDGRCQAAHGGKGRAPGRRALSSGVPM